MAVVSIEDGGIVAVSRKLIFHSLILENLIHLIHFALELLTLYTLTLQSTWTDYDACDQHMIFLLKILHLYPQ